MTDLSFSYIKGNIELIFGLNFNLIVPQQQQSDPLRVPFSHLTSETRNSKNERSAQQSDSGAALCARAGRAAPVERTDRVLLTNRRTGRTWQS